MTDTALYEFHASVPSTYGATSSVTLKTVTDDSHEGDYKCKASYNSDNKVRLVD